MKTKLSKKLLLISITWLVVTLASGPANAANWLMLQGTEPAGSADPVRVWGFVQVQIAY